MSSNLRGMYKRDISDDESPPRTKYKKHTNNRLSTNHEIVPSFDGYQLIGDSQFLRFAEQLLDKRRIQENGLSYLGYCVSGQKINDLLGRIRGKDFYDHVSSKIVLMIGTNDLLQGTNIERMCEGIRKLIDELQYEHDVRKLIILTVPPVPRLKYEKAHWDRLKSFNKFLLSMDNGDDGIYVIDACAKFLKPEHRLSVSPLPLKRSSSSSILRGTQKCDSPQVDFTLRIRLDPSGCRQAYYNNKPDKDFNQRMINLKRKSIENDEEISIKRKACIQLTSERNSDDSGISISSNSSRKSFSDSIVEDDHNDRDGGRDDSLILDGMHNLIKEDLFERYFSRQARRKDEIHLNRDGLLIIRRLIRDHIDSMV